MRCERYDSRASARSSRDHDLHSANQPAHLDFSEVYCRHADAVFRFCLSQLHDRSAAEDVTADVFAAAFAAFDRAPLDSEGVRPWLFRIARNATIDHQRKSRTRFLLFGALRSGRTHAADVESTVELRQELRDVLAAIRGLRRREQQLIGLRVGGGLTYAQIGDVMGIKENAARMATQRAIEKVRGAVGEDR
jgi:RNA polymerase sigma-70 factor (ECF subfamily)